VPATSYSKPLVNGLMWLVKMEPSDLCDFACYTNVHSCTVKTIGLHHLELPDVVLYSGVKQCHINR
jgi:hypothetical protein